MAALKPEPAASPKGRIPRRFGPLVFGAVQALLTTGFASGIAVARTSTPSGFMQNWPLAWATAYLVVLPIVLVMAPILRRFVDRVTD